MPEPSSALARQIVDHFVAASFMELPAEQRQQLAVAYHAALARAFQELTAAPSSPGANLAQEAATRAHAYTFGERAGEVRSVLTLAPSVSVRGLARAVEQFAGRELGVLRGARASTPEEPRLEPAPAPPTRAAWVERLSAEAGEAAWLILADQSVEVVRHSLAALLQRHLAADDPALRARLGQLLESQLGGVLTALFLSLAAEGAGPAVATQLGFPPQRFETYASKLRVHALARGGRALLDELLEPLLGAWLEWVRALPEEALPLLAEGERIDGPLPEQVGVARR